MNKNNILKVTLIGLVIIGIFLASLAFWIVPRSLTVREMSVQSPRWKGPPLKVALVSDTHGDRFHMPPSRIRALSLAVTNLKPDIILLGGDYVGGHFAQSGLPMAQRSRRSVSDNEFEAAVIEAHKSFKAPLGVFAVMGNHDCWWDCDEVRRLFANSHIKLLENNAVEISRAGGTFWVVGLEDEQTQAPNFASANRDVPPNSDILTLVHNTKLFSWPSNTSAIQFSGHSHGGQVRFPIIGAPVRMAFTEETVDKPLVQDGRVLVVTTGVGAVGLPVRFGVPPEIALITVSRGDVVHGIGQKRRPIEGR